MVSNSAGAAVRRVRGAAAAEDVPAAKPARPARRGRVDGRETLRAVDLQAGDVQAGDRQVGDLKPVGLRAEDLRPVDLRPVTQLVRSPGAADRPIAPADSAASSAADGSAGACDPTARAAQENGADGRTGRRTRRGAEESTEDLLRRYRLRGSSALRDRVVERHRDQVVSMAHGLATRLPRSVDAQDLVHAGMWGLMQAIASYEPERCDRFQAFMRIRVRGAMLDELRNLDFVPRLLRRRLRERNTVRARLCMELEREPTESELAAALGISETALLRRCEPAVWRIERGDDGDAEEDRCESLADHGVESPIEALTRRELLELIRASLDRVEWRVVQLYYLEGLNGKQVARRLRLSPSRICQLHARVLEKLKERFDA